MMAGYGTSVILLAHTSLSVGGNPIDKVAPSISTEAEELVEYAGRKCYANEEKLGTNPNWIQERIKDGHESILEHSSATFLIVCSRVVTHELVRHRIASYSQRSQRYVNEKEPRYITPPEYSGFSGIPVTDIEAMSKPLLDKLMAGYIKTMETCWDFYAFSISQGVPKEIARYVLPNACETQIVCTWNFREIRHVTKLRTSKRALPEMREVAGRIRDICCERWPQVFGDLGVSSDKA